MALSNALDGISWVNDMLFNYQHDLFTHLLDSNIFYCGTSRKILATVDTRSPNTVATIHNDSMVNTLYASRDGMHVITGDAHGVLKVWDIRSRKY